MTLHSDRLTLRAPAPADEPAFLAWYASPRRIAARGAVTQIDAWERFAAVLGHWQARGYGRFIVTRRDTGDVIGLVGPHFPGGWPEPELAWHIWRDDAEGHGFAREAAETARRHAYDRLGLRTIISLIAPGNTRSAALAKRMGARPETDISFIEDSTYTLWRHPSPEALQ